MSNINNDNKEVIFVKLTDSAYRAIEDYQKNQHLQCAVCPSSIKRTPDTLKTALKEINRCSGYSEVAIL
ncbi:hypothetical protein Bhyg_01967 [Pseudolycoriella hygida]|uniref:RNA polymerase II elongation factor ELL N-terminal domain-containing protein n=1 Tax=Pseudolycoriella hygida TaxID=35572 RepID=A0A9Q0NB03_9DIPT|nr:hypothetical protein Bhyg_01967 [Pseudolycoriella hygida]